MAKASHGKPPKPPGGGTNPVPPVTGLMASLTPENTVSLQWNPLPGATTYRVYRRDPDGKEYVPAIIQQTSYVDASVRAASTYVFSIAAVVGGRLGPKSNPVTITTN